MASISFVADDGRRAQRILVGLFIFLALIACSLFLIRYVMGPFALSKPQADFWDVAFKAIGGLVAIIGAILALSKYFDEREKENRVALIEAQSRSQRNARKYIFSLSRLPPPSQTAILAALLGKRQRNSSGGWFGEWFQWWQMIRLDLQSTPHHAILDHREDGVLLRNLSMDLARACRISLGFIDVSDPSAGSSSG